MGKAENLFFLFFSFHFLGSSRHTPDACLLSLSLVSLEGGGKAAKRNMEKVRAEHMQIAIQAQLEQQQQQKEQQGAAGATGKGSQAEATMWPKIQKGRADKRLTTLGGGDSKRDTRRKKRRRERGKEWGRGRVTEAAVKKWQSKTNSNGNESQVRARRAALPKDICQQQQQQHWRRTTNR